jgi:uroporphyrinogen decarboxylase
MDIGRAIRSVESDVILAGNLDPTAIFHKGSTVEAYDATKTLLKLVDGYKNFIPSSGCDIPPGSSVKNIEVFFKTVRES